LIARAPSSPLFPYTTLFRSNEMPGWTWLLVVPIFALQMILNLGIAFLLARLGFVFPDASQVMGVVARFLMYGSGVIFPVEHYLKDRKSTRLNSSHVSISYAV